jgi:hypothetical protein
MTQPPVETDQNGPPSYVRQKAAAALLDGFLKKEVISSPVADLAAKEIFFASNKKCKGWCNPSTLELSSGDESLLGLFRGIVDDFFSVDLGDDVDVSWANICENARSGPGASVGVRGYSFYAKHFASELTATSDSLYHVYRHYTKCFPEFSNAENIRQENHGSPRYVQGSNASFVPKTVEVSRMICSEPTVNMYLQLGMGELIAKRLQRFFGIDLSVQPSINRYMAKLGSLGIGGSDGRGFATIDLKSASDSISLGLIGWVLPPDWLDAILVLRSPKARIDGVYHELNMVSTMGNGFTFPLQTAIFSCLVVACIAMDDKSVSGRSFRHQCLTPSNPLGQFSVFGDDIIIAPQYADRCCRLLELLGFTVNSNKSFASGPFRESCGHDYLNGYNIRPIYLRQVNTDQDLTVLINLLLEWSTRTGIGISRTIEVLWNQFTGKHLLVPFDENMNAGIRVPLNLLSDPKRRKQYNISRDANLSFAYRRYAPVGSRVRVGDGVIHTPRGVKPLIYNLSGLLMSYLSGEIRGGTFTVRNNRAVPYDTKHAVSPYWDWQRPTIESKFFGLTFDKARWDIVAYDALYKLIHTSKG